MHENKPLIEYGDLNSQHHHMVHEEEEEQKRMALINEQPPRLWIVDGPGNLYMVKWTHTFTEIPLECQGAWNHKGKAMDAINGAMARIANEALQDAAVIAAAKRAAEIEEHLVRENEVAEETARLIAESTPKEEKKAKPRKATGKPVKV